MKREGLLRLGTLEPTGALGGAGDRKDAERLEGGAGGDVGSLARLLAGNDTWEFG
jgi:hypothetical protein